MTGPHTDPSLLQTMTEYHRHVLGRIAEGQGDDSEDAREILRQQEREEFEKEFLEMNRRQRRATLSNLRKMAKKKKR